MIRLARLGQSGRKAIVEGIFVILLGAFLILGGQVVPKVGYQLFFLYIFGSALWTLIPNYSYLKQLRVNS